MFRCRIRGILSIESNRFGVYVCDCFVLLTRYLLLFLVLLGYFQFVRLLAATPAVS